MVVFNVKVEINVKYVMKQIIIFWRDQHVKSAVWLVVTSVQALQLVKRMVVHNFMSFKQITVNFLVIIPVKIVVNGPTFVLLVKKVTLW